MTSCSFLLTVSRCRLGTTEHEFFVLAFRFFLEDEPFSVAMATGVPTRSQTLC